MTRRELVERSLEACRVEMLRRVREAGLPIVIKTTFTVVTPNENGWISEYQDRNVNILRHPRVMLSLGDRSVEHVALGLREQLEPLAVHLAATTDIGSREAQFLPGLQGSEAILARHLTGLAIEYLTALKRLDRGEPRLAERLAAEVEEFANAKDFPRVAQLAIAGVRPKKMLMHRGVSIRPLSPFERGAVVDEQADAWDRVRPNSDFVVPVSFGQFHPSSVVEIKITDGRLFETDNANLANRVALAFYMTGYDLSSAGSLAVFDAPRWVGRGISHRPFPIQTGVVGHEQSITQRQFERVVDLAYCAPSFSGIEASAREIALFRVLRGCGARSDESSFLDFAIALEAALLADTNTELSYRFSLYGATFLRDERDPEKTFAALRRIYAVRSKLVHGSRVAASDRVDATKSARDIALAVTRRAIERGWPKATELDKLAISRRHRQSPTSTS